MQIPIFLKLLEYQIVPKNKENNKLFFISLGIFYA